MAPPGGCLSTCPLCERGLKQDPLALLPPNPEVEITVESEDERKGVKRKASFTLHRGDDCHIKNSPCGTFFGVTQGTGVGGSMRSPSDLRAAAGTRLYADSTEEARLLCLAAGECETAAELRREKAARFLVRDIVEGLGRALHYTKLIQDFKLKQVCTDFVLKSNIYGVYNDVDFVAAAKVRHT